MKISPISIRYNYASRNTACSQHLKSNIQFQGKHDCAKLLGGLFGGAGTLGALGGIAIMTGGVSILPTLAYGALCGGFGAAIGHKLDKDSKNKKD